MSQAQDSFRIFVLNPVGHPDPALAIAACRAGAVGVLNAEGGMARADLHTGLEALANLGRGKFGVKLGDPASSLAVLADFIGRGLAHLVVPVSALSSHADQLQVLRHEGICIWAEVIDAQALDGELACQPDGWWAKGNEAGGFVGSQGAFVLLQSMVARSGLPVLVRGGIGVHAAAACKVGGAAGVVLDDQLLALEESPLHVTFKARLKHFSGAEAQLLACGEGPSPRCRVWAGHRAGAGIVPPPVWDASTWHGSAGGVPVGQAACLSVDWAARYRRVANVVREVERIAATYPQLARSQALPGESSPLARAHGTRLPFVQGPMTHVSDRAEFIAAVAEAGALPMVAVSLMKGRAISALLGDVAERLGDRSWGVGLLGFVPPEILEEQRAAIRMARPRFALIAGGRPDQARELEEEGILTYLHVPAAGLLRQFVEDGASHFVFEGRECGGHIGPLGSFTLWESMLDTLLELPQVRRNPERFHVLLAGGIHDARSAAMAATMFAPLAELGVRVGFLMGTAYCFTQEAVQTGAITANFQSVILECASSVELVNGPGQASRVAATPVADDFRAAKADLEARGCSVREIKDALEHFSLGRLRLATKGLVRRGADGALSEASHEEQRNGGMYMIGETAGLRGCPLTLAQLHREVSDDAVQILRESVQEVASPFEPRLPPVDVAIVGIGCLLPGCTDARAYWEAIVDGRQTLQEVPADRWSHALYFDADRTTRDKVYSRWGGFIDDVPFDPLKFGLPPASLQSIDPMQLLGLVAVAQALEDAGAVEDAGLRQRTGVILGFSGGLGEKGMGYAARAELPRLLAEVDPGVLDRLPEWTEDSFAGLLPNVVAGRIANRFDFHGVNFTIDAACASSLASVHQAVQELRSGRCDRVIAGGVDTLQNPFGFLCFSKTQALSPSGSCRTFDAQADGIAISEGLAIVVLKRLEDAERDGDRIYSIIKGVGSSSDGRAKGLTAPLPAGQRLAIRRAWAQAGASPATCTLWEAHGTGTVAGDQVELKAAMEVLAEAGAAPRSCAIGSVKTNIGHTKAAAGVAGLIKASLAQYHRVLPPHRGVSRPNPQLLTEGSPLYLSQLPRPWVASRSYPRRACVSAFGFGGTNFHAVLEEYRGDFRPRPAVRDTWGHELLVWRGGTRADLLQSLESTQRRLAAGEESSLLGLAASLAGNALGDGEVLAMVASSLEDAAQRIGHAASQLVAGGALPDGVFVGGTDAAPAGKLALLFPGQGSQYPDMLRELAVLFPELSEAVEDAEAAVAAAPTFADRPRLSRLVWPGERFSPGEETAARTALTRTEVAQPALGAISIGLLRLLRQFGLRHDMAAGHSYGEYVALHSAGVLSSEDVFRISEARGRFIVEEAAGNELGAMAAISADAAVAQTLIEGIPDLQCANMNSPRQTIVSGTRKAIEAAVQACESAGVSIRPLPVAAAFHSPLVAPSQQRLTAFVAAIPFTAPAVPVYGNTLARPHPLDPGLIKELMSRHLVEPVRYAEMIEAMYDDGARIFLEVGPKNVLSSLVGQILGDRSHCSIAIDDSGSGVRGLLTALAKLLVSGVRLELSRLYTGRSVEPPPPPLSPTTWLVNGGYAHRPGEYRDVSRPQQKGSAAFAESTSSSCYFPVNPADLPLFDEADKEAWKMKQNDMTYNSGGGGADQAMAAYHETMRRFLQMQERVMLAYLAASPQGNAFATMAPLPESSSPGGGRPVEGLFVRVPAAVPSEPAPMRASAPAPVVPAPAAIVSGAAQAPAVEAAPQALSAANAVPSGSPLDLRDLLLTLVEERTGYPRDMLGLEQDMEADLGIDSIKRAEILGALRKALPAATSDVLKAKGEELAALHTLQAIIDFVGGVAVEGHAPFDLTEESEPVCAPLPRYVVRAHAEPLAVQPPVSLAAGRYLVVGHPGCALAEALCTRMQSHSGVELLRLDIAELGNVERIAALLEGGGENRPVLGLIYLPLLHRQDMACESFEEWREAVALDLKPLFMLMPILGPGFLKAGRVLTASAMGGYLGRDLRAGALSSAIAGGLVGFAKTLSREWPGCVAKHVDLDPDEEAGAWAGHLLAEFLLPGGRREVGYPAGVRTIFRTAPASLPPYPLEGRNPSTDWVVLAIGGARGITAECLMEFARRRCRLVLVGRSPLPEAELSETAVHQTAQALKAHFLAQAREQGRSLRPVEIEQRVAELLREREVRANLEAFRAEGGGVEYRIADMRDPQSVERLLADLYDDYARVDAVLFGAGVIDDSLVTRKTDQGVANVLDTKLDGAWLLASRMRPESLKYFVLFTSIAGRYGNPGQADYATANESLNRMACLLRARWGAAVKVAAINWGPWDATTHGAGMVTPETKRQFEAAGVRLVDPRGGREFLIRELLYGPADEIELIAGESPWEYAEAALSAVAGETHDCVVAPMTYGCGDIEHQARGLRVPVDIDLVNFPVLDQHRLDGKPVMPFVGALELMAEVVEFAGFGKVVEMHDCRMFSGLVVEGDCLPVSLWLTRLDEHRVQIEIVPDDGVRPYYRGTAVLGAGFPEPVTAELPKPRGGRIDAGGVYRSWLFHGPLLQSISAFLTVDENGVVARMRPCPERACMPAASQSWCFDVTVLDGVLQAVAVWTRSLQGALSLPQAVRRVRRYGGSALPGELMMQLDVLTPGEEPSTLSNARVVGLDGRVHLEIEGIEGMADAKLNRLGGGWSGGSIEGVV